MVAATILNADIHKNYKTAQKQKQTLTKRPPDKKT